MTNLPKLNKSNNHTPTLDMLFLELSLYANAYTARELKLREVVGLLNNMILSGEEHSETSRMMVKEAMGA